MEHWWGIFLLVVVGHAQLNS